MVNKSFIAYLKYLYKKYECKPVYSEMTGIFDSHYNFKYFMMDSETRNKLFINIYRDEIAYVFLFYNKTTEMKPTIIFVFKKNECFINDKNISVSLLNCKNNIKHYYNKKIDLDLSDINKLANIKIMRKDQLDTFILFSFEIDFFLKLFNII